MRPANNVKPGDRAIIIGSMSCPENIGCLVEVVRGYVQGEVLPEHRFRYDTSTEVVWVVESIGRPLQLVESTGLRIYVPLAAVRDKALRRLPDDVSDMDTQELPAVTGGRQRLAEVADA